MRKIIVLSCIFLSTMVKGQERSMYSSLMDTLSTYFNYRVFSMVLDRSEPDTIKFQSIHVYDKNYKVLEFEGDKLDSLLIGTSNRNIIAGRTIRCNINQSEFILSLNFLYRSNFKLTALNGTR